MAVINRLAVCLVHHWRGNNEYVSAVCSRCMIPKPYFVCLDQGIIQNDIVSFWSFCLFVCPHLQTWMALHMLASDAKVFVVSV